MVKVIADIIMTYTVTVVIDVVHYFMLYFEILTTKLFIVPDMNFKGHSRSSAMSSFVRSPELSITDQKSGLHLFSEKNRELP